MVLMVRADGSQTPVDSSTTTPFRPASAGRPTSGELVSIGSAVYSSPSAADLAPNSRPTAGGVGLHRSPDPMGELQLDLKAAVVAPARAAAPSRDGSPDGFQVAGHLEEAVGEGGMDHHDRVDMGRDGRPVEEVTVAGMLVGTSVSLVTKRQDKRRQTRK